ncbi:MAG: agmatine deiminase family protein [Acidobacteriaceae bacterium]|nr:agmatine deiminase family protein [Acidobacteriaceae bacterium]MBV9778433.1 agmatine deiminase family protein [Acidobacteriaceae bacterium]
MQHRGQCPAQLGFRVAAEWEEQEATWLAWPNEEGDWPGKFEPIPWVYGEVVRHLARVEKVRILVRDAVVEQCARVVLDKCHVEMHNVEFLQVATDRSWTRDYCPMFLRNARGERAILNWRFNGWAKYENSTFDDAVTEVLAPQLGIPMWTPEWNSKRVVLEGGSIDVNGAGLILTTEECLLSAVQARNPGFTRDDIEQVFANYLAAPRTLWLKNGIAGDDTHGHIDDLARFTDSRTIAIATEQDASDPNYEPLKENFALLREMRDQRGESLRIETLPMPEPVFFGGQRLPASYANFYVANRVVLVPTFNDPNDRVALNKLTELFPNRQIIGIGARDLVLGLGTLHCMTQQQPA